MGSQTLIPWNEVDTVLLDMDGTLLDLHFDNHFWQAHVPLRYAEHRGISFDAAREELADRYRARAGTLEWYSVNFWEDELEMDIMLLKEEVAHLIAIHPSVTDFLAWARSAGKRIVLATNAHHKSVTLKMARTGLTPHFDSIITSHALGHPKESVPFWQALQAVEPFDPERTLLVDDSLPVLEAARAFGIHHLVTILKPDTRQPTKASGDYPALSTFAELIP